MIGTRSAVGWLRRNWQSILRRQRGVIRPVDRGLSPFATRGSRRWHGMEQLEPRILLSASLTGASEVDEGSPYALTLNHTTAAVDRWEVDWGDGILETVFGGFAVDEDEVVNHTYADGTQELTISATAYLNGGGTANPTKNVTVNDVAPQLSFIGPAVAPQGEPYTLNLDVLDPGDDALFWRINWGDGFIDEVAGSATEVSHEYPSGTGGYAITVTAADEDGVYVVVPDDTGSPGARIVPGGTLDPYFNNGELLVTGLDEIEDFEAGSGSDFKDEGRRVATQTDGKILVVGQVSGQIAVARYRPNGTIDDEFGTNGVSVVQSTTGGGISIGLQSDGGILVAGADDDDLVMMRFTTSGAQDMDFGDSGVLTTGFDVQDDSSGQVFTKTSEIGQFRFAVQQDDRIVVPGRSVVTDPSAIWNTQLQVKRFDPDGSPDELFGDMGTKEVFFNTVTLNGQARQAGLAHSVVIQRDDSKIVVTGKILADPSGAATPVEVGVVVRLQGNGDLDTSFGSSGVVQLDYSGSLSDPRFTSASEAQIDPSDGRIIVTGHFTPPSITGFGLRELAVARLHADGSVDDTFGLDVADDGDADGYFGVDAPGLVPGVDSDIARSVRLLRTGNLVYGGTADRISDSTRMGIALLDGAGQLDFTFGDLDSGTGQQTGMLGLSTDPAVETELDSIELTPGDRIIVTGKAEVTSGEPSIVVGRLLATPGLLVDVANARPNLTIPDGEVVEGNIFTFDADAVDPDGDDALIEYSLLATPFGNPQSIIDIKSVGDPTPGLITFTTSTTSSTNGPGRYHFIVRATDEHGATRDVSFAVDVLESDDAVNRPPILTAFPPEDATLDELYSFLASATDPDGDALTFEIEGPLDGMENNILPLELDDPNTASVIETSDSLTLSSGELQQAIMRWVPTRAEVVGNGSEIEFVLTVKDPGGLEDSRDFTVTVANSDPIIVHPPSAAALSGVDYTSAVFAMDPDPADEGFLEYFFVDEAGVRLEPESPPVADMEIDVDTGLINWETPPSTPSSVTIRVQVADGRGGFSEIETVDINVQTAGGTIKGTKFIDRDGDGVFGPRFVAGSVSGSQLHHALTVLGTDYIAGGVGALREEGGDTGGGGTGDLEIDSFSGTVNKALLYWQGPALDVAGPTDNATVEFDGTEITGNLIGISSPGFWEWEDAGSNLQEFDVSFSYVADVTSLVSAGTTSYSLDNFIKQDTGGLTTSDINGVSLLVFYDDGDATNNRDIVVFEGNDSTSAFVGGGVSDPAGWNVHFDGIRQIDPATEEARLQLHVSDGQDWLDDPVTINGSVLSAFASSNQVFQGAADATPTNGYVGSDDPNPETVGSLWDVVTEDVTDFLSAPGTNAIEISTITTVPEPDTLRLVALVLDLPAGAAPDPAPVFTMFLDENRNGLRDEGEPYDMDGTDEAGDYVIENVPPGTYFVAEEQLPGWVQMDLDRPGFSYEVTIEAGETIDRIDFVNRLATDENHAPDFLETKPTHAVVDTTLFYRAEAVDPDGDHVSYEILSKPENAVFAPGGIFIWTPTPEQLGTTHTVSILAEDGRGGSDVLDFVLTVRPKNLDPVVAPPPNAVVSGGTEFKYEIEAVDPNGDTPIYVLSPDSDLADGSDGFTFSRHTGQIEWDVPTASTFLGMHYVAFDVLDGRGGRVSSGFWIEVSDKMPPEMTATGTDVFEDDPLNLTVHLSDPNTIGMDGETILLSVVGGPTGLGLDDPGTPGVVESLLTLTVSFEDGTEGAAGIDIPVVWTPSVGTAGEHSFEIVATEQRDVGRRFATTLPVDVRVLPLGAKLSPSLVPREMPNPIADQDYEFKLVGVDPDGGVVTFELIDVKVDGALDSPAINNYGVVLSSEGLLTWTPDGVDHVGTENLIRLKVVDDDTPAAYAEYTISLPVDPLVAPSVSTSVGAAVATESWTTVIHVTDLDGVTGQEVDLAIIRGPSGMEFVGDDDTTEVTLQDPSTDPDETLHFATATVEWTPGTGDVGMHEILIRATDVSGEFTDLLFPVEVFREAALPVLDTRTIGTAVVGEEFNLTLEASDPDGGAVTYSLVTSPDDGFSVLPGGGMTLNATTGLLEWTPAALGTYRVEFEVIDNDDVDAGLSEPNRVLFGFDLQVVPDTTGSAPTLENADDDTGFAFVNQPYEFPLLVADDATSPVVFSFGSGNEARRAKFTDITVVDETLHKTSAVLTWTPNTPGTHRIEFVLTDDDDPDGFGGLSGLSSTYWFDLTVVDDSPPVPTSVPEPATEGEPWGFEITYDDPDGDDVTLELIDSPIGMALRTPGDGLSGEPAVVAPVVYWDVPANLAGSETFVTREFTIRADDGTSLPQLWTYTVYVLNDAVGTTAAPEFLTESVPGVAMRGEEYRFTFEGIDPDGGAITYTLDTGNEADTAKIDPETGEFVWTPGTIGEFTIQIRATDDESDYATISFDVAVVERNLLPELLNRPTGPAAKDRPYEFLPEVKDPDGGTVTYALGANNVAAGAKLDPVSGLFSWTPRAEGTFLVEFVVTDDDDPDGEDGPLEPGRVTFSYPLVVVDNAPPQVNLDALPAQSVQLDAAPIVSYTLDLAEGGIVFDPNGDPLTFTLNSGPDGMTMDSDGLIDWDVDVTPPPDPGLYRVDLDISDDEGGVTNLIFDVRAFKAAGDELPDFSSTPVGRARVGVPWLYQATATDPEGDEITFRLLDAGTNETISDAGIDYVSVDGMTISAGNIVQWVPPEVGDYHFAVIADDSNDGDYTAQLITLEVRERLMNEAPLIDAQEIYDAVAGERYEIRFTATDPDMDQLRWFIDKKPTDLEFTPDDDGGALLTWTPQADDIGDHPIKVRVLDTFGAGSQASFDLGVRRFNAPPRVTNAAGSVAIVNELYEYVIALADEDDLVDSLTVTSDASNPSWLNFENTEDGYRFYTTHGTAVAPTEIKFTVSDGTNTVDYTYDLEVRSDVGPRILSEPMLLAVVGTPYVYVFEVEDTAGGTLDLTTPVVPSGLTNPLDFDEDDDGTIFTRTMTWTPHVDDLVDEDTPTVFTFEFKAQESGMGASITQRIPIYVVPANSAPVIVEVPDAASTYIPGFPFRFEVIATDDQRLDYELSEEAPEGMEIDEFGRIRWLPTDANTVPSGGTFSDINITVTDPFGLTDTATFSLSKATNTPPEALLEASQDRALIDDTVVFFTLVRDDFGIEAITLTVQPDAGGAAESLTIDPMTGQAAWTPNTAGSYTATLTVTDEDGASPATAPTVSVLVVDPASSNAPQLRLLDPSDFGTVRSVSDVIGIVDDPDGDLAEWTLELIPQAGGNAIELKKVTGASGEVGSANAETVGLLAELDPRIISDGAYRLLLSATDAAGNESGLVLPIDIASDEKLGDLTLSFTDMTVNVGGLPVTVQRTYDSTRSDVDDDFGFGWSLDLYSVGLDTPVSNQPVRDGLGDWVYEPFFQGMPVTVTLPGGQDARFQLAATVLSTVALEESGIPPFAARFAAGLLATNAGLVSLEFIPEPGLDATLEFVGIGDNNLLYREGFFFDLLGNPFNPASRDLGLGGDSNISAYKLTTGDGVEYLIDSQTNALTRITDPNDNQLNVRNNRVTSIHAGETVAELDIKRSRGRITSITDPLGNSVRYEYDDIGNLVAVTNRVDETTTLIYDKTERPHFLTEIKDADEKSILAASYEDDGLINGVTDPSGHAADFSFDLDPEAYPDGFSIETVEDAFDATTELVRDDEGNLVRRIQRESFESGVVASYLVTLFEYDDVGRLTAESEPFQLMDDLTDGEDDNNRYIFVGPNNDSEALIWRQRIEREEWPGDRVVIERVTDAGGGTTIIRTDKALHNQVFRVTDALGNRTNNRFNDVETGGLLRDTKDADGNESRFSYVTGGNLENVTQIVDGEPVIVSKFEYDSFGRLETVEDVNEIQRHFAYDAIGNQILSYHTATDVDGSDKIIVNRTDYDGEGRVERSSQYILDDTDPVTISHLDSETPTWTTSTEYNVRGLVSKTIDRFGAEAFNTYDSRSNIIESRTQTKDETGTTKWIVSRTVYDINGRPIYTIDPQVVDDNSTALEGAITGFGSRTIYDELGRVIESRRLDDLTIRVLVGVNDNKSTDLPDGYDQDVDAGDDTVITKSITEYDANGRVAKTISSVETNPVPAIPDRETYFEYDHVGRQTAVITKIGTDLFLRTESVYDKAGRQIAVYDNITQTDPIDPTTIMAAGRRETRFVYDKLGRQVAVISPEVVDPSITSGDNRQRVVAETEYDSQSRRSTTRENITVTGAFTGYTTLQALAGTAGYDDAEVLETTYEYDDAGRLTAVNQPLVTIDNPEAAGTIDVHPRYEYGYDDFGNQTSITTNVYVKSDGTTIKHLRKNASGDEVVSTDPADETTTTTTLFTFDAFNRQRSRQLPLGVDAGDGSFTEWSIYDDAALTSSASGVGGGKLAYSIDFEGRVTEYLYDNTAASGGRLVEKRYHTLPETTTVDEDTTAADLATDLDSNSLVEAVKYTYDALGRLLITIQDADGDFGAPSDDDQRVTTNVYTEFGLLESVDSPEGKINYEYDDLGRLTLTWTTDPENPTSGDPITQTAYTYDSLGRQDTVTTEWLNGGDLTTDQVTDYNYDNLGRIDTVLLPNNIVTEFKYDALDRATAVTHFRNVGDTDRVFDSGDEFVETFSYTYDNGQRTSETTRKYDDDGTLTDTLTYDWQYDDLGRLTKETFVSSASPVKNYETDYAFDLTGNRLSKLDVFANDEARDILFDYKYDANDRLVQDAATPQSLSTTTEIKDQTFGSTLHGEMMRNGSPETPIFVPGKVGDSLLFDDTNEQVDLQESSGDALLTDAYSERTVSLWFKVEDDLLWWRDLYVEGDTNAGMSIRFKANQYSGGDGAITVKVYEDASTTASNTFRVDSELRYEWLHVVAVYNGSNSDEIILYVNNVEDTAGSGSAAEVPASSPTPRSLTFGAGTSSGDFLGQMDDVRVYDRDLSAEEAEQLFNLEDVADGLIAHWTLDGAASVATRSYYGPIDLPATYTDTGPATNLTYRYRYMPDSSDPGNPNATNAVLLEETEYHYDHAGRLSLSWVDTTGDGIPESLDGYIYDDNGQRVMAGSLVLVGDINMDMVIDSFDVDPFELGLADAETYEAKYHVEPLYVGDINADGSFNNWDVSPFEALIADATGEEEVDLVWAWAGGAKQLLNDNNNATGFAQVIEQWEVTDIDDDHEPLFNLERSYTLGLDVVSQTTIDLDTLTATTHHFLYDAHGSTRALTNDSDGLVTQTYDFDAYGVAITFDASAALTSLLYSGEQSDANTGWQYLRARYYDPASGRFNRLDPFAGTTRNPQSLHKYGYVHGNPINNIDPSGNVALLAGTLAGLAQSVGIRIQHHNRTMTAGAYLKALGTSLAITSGLLVYQVIYTPPLRKALNEFAREVGSLNPSIARQVRDIAHSIEIAIAQTASVPAITAPLAPVIPILPIALKVYAVYNVTNLIINVTRVYQTLLEGINVNKGPISLNIVSAELGIIKVIENLAFFRIDPADDVRKATTVLRSIKQGDFGATRANLDSLWDSADLYLNRVSGTLRSPSHKVLFDIQF